MEEKFSFLESLLWNKNVPYALRWHPKPDATFERWSGINKTTHSVHVSKIKEIGKHTINRKHKFMIAK